jgi:hypothetical protein
MGMTRQEIQKRYREKNKEKIRESNKRYREENKEKVKEQRRRYKEKNKEKISEQSKKDGKRYREKNKEKISERKKIYYQENKEQIRKYYRNWKKNKLKNDKLFLLQERIRNSIYKSLKHKTSKYGTTEEILGCSFDEFKNYIEGKFEPWMNWDNYGLYNGELNYGWDLDHVIPISTAKTIEDLYRLNHYTNFQPLCSYTNRDLKKDIIL